MVINPYGSPCFVLGVMDSDALQGPGEYWEKSQ